MNSYTATLLSDHGYATEEFEAASPEDALKLAQEHESKFQVWVEPYSEPAPIEPAAKGWTFW